MGYEEKTDELMVRATEIMNSGMEIVDLFVNKNYLINLSEHEPLPLDPSQKFFSYMSLFEISKIVYNMDEDINDKLVSVYSALSNFGSIAILVLASDEVGVRFYLGTRDTSQPYVAKEILSKSLKGNFPGIEISEKSPDEVQRFLEGTFPEVYSNLAVSSVSIVPSTRDENRERFVQGIEKFIDSMSGENFTAVFISSPLSKAELESKKRGYEEIFTALSQYSQVNLTYSENDSESVAKGITDSFSSAINTGISETTGTNSGTSDSTSRSTSRSTSFDFFGTGHTGGTSKSTSHSTSSGTSASHTDTSSETETKSKSTSDTTTTTTGSTSTIAVTKQNKTVQALLEKIDQQLKRIRSCESYGLWDSACYFVSENPGTALVAANTFKAIVAGEGTSVENSFINTWDNDYDTSEKSLVIMDHLRYGVHPRFRYIPPVSQDGFTEQIITPASLISGIELPVLMGLPYKSVNGVTSVMSAEFGRNVFAKGMASGARNINLGAIFHMGEIFPESRVRLDLESLSAHCFITGSTGSGKSNTTYKIIDELISSKNNVKFLVIEPAKGEYKIAFGNMPGINIFTTNPKYYNMLGINPLAFHDEVHVLEHLDRLIEIFSACWPLYAAMPALLKSSFEQAYIEHGWDLNHSIHIDRGNGKFPSFKDIVEILPRLLDESDFSAQTKGDYVGALVTRVKSLTNGLIGQIFTEDAVDDALLFDENTIIDISRIGSSETKALLMGTIILKLSEYRQSTATGTDCPLKHITVLEEAHNLLKRTSTEQGQESSNVQGKSVEMISNSIAEMRTYGEGFIIVDQSPTAVDISAIKNTNTKIIMRLPEAADCEAVGHALGLNEAQILELSKLDKGVAAIYQNNWLEAVLTKIDKSSDRFRIASVPVNDGKLRLSLLGDILEELVSQRACGQFKLSWFGSIFSSSKAPEFVKAKYQNMLREYQKTYNEGFDKKEYYKLIYNLLECDNLVRIFADLLPPPVKKREQYDDNVKAKCQQWLDAIYKNLDRYAEFLDFDTKREAFIAIILTCIFMNKKDIRYKLILNYYDEKISKSKKRK